MLAMLDYGGSRSQFSAGAFWFVLRQTQGKISSRFQPLDTTASNYYFQVPTTQQNMKYSNNQVGPMHVAGELSDRHFNG